MNGAFDIAAIGLRAQQNALDILANNIANINTPSFKRSDVHFSEMVARQADSGVAAANLAPPPSLASTHARARMDLNIQGEIVGTGDSSDLAINGQGFIELMGPRGQTYLWRGGALEVSEDGYLSGPGGMALAALITIPEGAFDLTIAADGAVSARIVGQDEPVRLGQIGLVTLNDQGAVERSDGGLYALRDRSAVSDLTPGQDSVFVQGAIERSNVDLSSEMIQLMIVQRAFAANAQIVQAADQIMAIANTLRR